MADHRARDVPAGYHRNLCVYSIALMALGLLVTGRASSCTAASCVCFTYLCHLCSCEALLLINAAVGTFHVIDMDGGNIRHVV